MRFAKREASACPPSIPSARAPASVDIHPERMKSIARRTAAGCQLERSSCDHGGFGEHPYPEIFRSVIGSVQGDDLKGWSESVFEWVRGDGWKMMGSCVSVILFLVLRIQIVCWVDMSLLKYIYVVTDPHRPAQLSPTARLRLGLRLHRCCRRCGRVDSSPEVSP